MNIRKINFAITKHQSIIVPENPTLGNCSNDFQRIRPNVAVPILFLDLSSICANFSDFFIAAEKILGSKNIVTCLETIDMINAEIITA